MPPAEPSSCKGVAFSTQPTTRGPGALVLAALLQLGDEPLELREALDRLEVDLDLQVPPVRESAVSALLEDLQGGISVALPQGFFGVGQVGGPSPARTRSINSSESAESLLMRSPISLYLRAGAFSGQGREAETARRRAARLARWSRGCGALRSS